MAPDSPQLKPSSDDKEALPIPHQSARQQPKELNKFRLAICCLFLLLFCLFIRLANSLPPQSVLDKPIPAHINDEETQRFFQIYKPVEHAANDKVCDQDLLLMDHEFGFSYGHPYVGTYEPPNCDFNTVTMNLTVTSRGRQFDRLALMFLGDIEVFRTSTAEPTSDGIIWTYIKEMSQYNALWQNPQKIIFDLGNLIDDTYTAPFKVRLTATFSLSTYSPRTADSILPISAQRAALDRPSAFVSPPENATVALALPESASRAVVSIAACGQATEEFWYSNVLSSDTAAFNDTVGELYGFSPFREIQLLVDGHLGGVVWPFPVIFTGGIAPGFWRPIVGIDAFDLREPEIDITPFLPLIADGQPHTFEIRVVGLEEGEDGSAQLSHHVGSNWIVSGKIFVFSEDEPRLQSTADFSSMQKIPHIVDTFEPTFSRSLVQNPVTGKNENLSYSVGVTRILTVSSLTSTWTQALEYSNDGVLTEEGATQSNKQYTSGRASAFDRRNGESVVVSSVSQIYPLTVNSIYTTNDNGFSITASLSRSLYFASDVIDVISLFSLTTGPSEFNATQYGDATYTSITGEGSFSTGDTTEDFREHALGATYERHVRAVNGTVVPNNTVLPFHAESDLCWTMSSGRDSVRALLGRGPGMATGLYSSLVDA